MKNSPQNNSPKKKKEGNFFTNFWRSKKSDVKADDVKKAMQALKEERPNLGMSKMKTNINFGEDKSMGGGFDACFIDEKNANRNKSEKFSEQRSTSM